MTDRSWRDQPKILEGAKVKTTFRLSHQQVEIREASDGTYYVTVGNLFGSQTLYVPDAAKVLDAIEHVKLALEAREKNEDAPATSPPEGTRLMESD
jgi:hypothetical protein